MKTCSTCKKQKELSCYVVRNRYGKQYYENTCKECKSIYDKQRYKEKREHILLLCNKRYSLKKEEIKKSVSIYREKNKETINKKASIYFKTKQGKKVRRKNIKKWEQKEQNKIKIKCYRIVSSALKNKIITKKPCSVCGLTKKNHAHHNDYNKPLEIIWFCDKHHAELHRKNEKQLKKAKNDIS